MSMSPQEIYAEIKRLSARDLATLNRLLRDEPGWGTAGARTPSDPQPPLDAVGISLIPDVVRTGKASKRP